MILTVSIITLLHTVISFTYNLNLNLDVLGYNVGFTIFVLSIVSYILIYKRKRLGVYEGVLIGSMGLLANALLSVIVGYTLFNVSYGSTVIFTLSLRYLLSGMVYGSFAGWISKANEKKISKMKTKIKINKILACLIIAVVLLLSSFSYGFYSARHAEEVIIKSEVETIEEGKIEEARNIHREIVVTLKEKNKTYDIIKEEYHEDKPSASFLIFGDNMKKASATVLSSGILLIPISYNTGLVLGYDTSLLGFDIFNIVILEFISFIIFSFSIFYFLSNVLTREHSWKRYLSVTIILLVISTIILYASSYVEIASIL